MSNNTVDIITFFVYPDGIARHTYGLNGIVKYDVIALYPKSMFMVTNKGNQKQEAGSL